jgi:hypothetical protein
MFVLPTSKTATQPFMRQSLGPHPSPSIASSG